MNKLTGPLFLLLALSLSPVSADQVVALQPQKAAAPQAVQSEGELPLEARLQTLLKGISAEARLSQKHRPVIYSSLAQAQRWNLKVRPATAQSSAAVKL